MLNELNTNKTTNENHANDVSANDVSSTDLLKSEFETIDEVWNALCEARAEICRLRKRLGEHNGCSQWGVKDAIALNPSLEGKLLKMICH